MGLKPEYTRLRIEPCFPSHWDSANATRRFNNCIYNIEYRRADENYIVYDGEKIEGNLLPEDMQGGTHTVIVYVAR